MKSINGYAETKKELSQHLSTLNDYLEEKIKL